MIYFEIEEFLGVSTTSLGVGICTTTLLSCSAIIMFNGTTGHLGVYHYPAGALGIASVQEAIVAMFNRVQPTEILVQGPKPAKFNESQYEQEIVTAEFDVAKMIKSLRKIGRSHVSKRDEGGFSGVWVDQNRTLKWDAPSNILFTQQGSFPDMPTNLATVGAVTFYKSNDSGEGAAYVKKLAGKTAAEIEKRMMERYG